MPRRTAALLLSIVLAVVAAGCSDDADSDGGDADATTTTEADPAEQAAVDDVLDGVVAQLVADGFTEDVATEDDGEGSDEGEDELDVSSCEGIALFEDDSDDTVGGTAAVSRGSLLSGDGTIEHVELDVGLAPSAGDLDVVLEAFADDEILTCLTDVFEAEGADATAERLPPSGVGDDAAGLTLTGTVDDGAAGIPFVMVMEFARSGRVAGLVSVVALGTAVVSVDRVELLGTLVEQLAATAD